MTPDATGDVEIGKAKIVGSTQRFFRALRINRSRSDLSPSVDRSLGVADGSIAGGNGKLRQGTAFG